MSDNCCIHCKREALKKQCRIDTWTGAGGASVKILHLPTGMVAIGIDEDESLDALANALKILEDKNIDTVAKFRKEFDGHLSEDDELTIIREEFKNSFYSNPGTPEKISVN